MDTRNDDRTKLARRVAELTRTNPQIRDMLPVVDRDGFRPVISVLLEDRVGDVFDHIRRSHPAGANVVVGDAQGHFVPLAVRYEPDGTGPAFGELETDCPVNVDSTMAMLVAYALIHRGHAVRCLPVVSNFEVELEELPAPSPA